MAHVADGPQPRGPLLPGERRRELADSLRRDDTLLREASEVQLVKELVRRTRWLYLNEKTLVRYDPHGVAAAIQDQVNGDLADASAKGSRRVA